MLPRLADVLSARCRMVREAVIVTGISGGPDSLVLLDVLHRLQYPVLVAHLDHGLRPSSKEEADAVRRRARDLNLPVEVERVDVAAQAQESGQSIEEAARNARYRFLFDLASRVKAQAVAVAHTADDQVETVLMHLLRGAGLSGLKGMAVYSLPNAWSAGIPLVRPLLGVWRHEVLAYCQENGLQPSLDATNLDTRFFRNRLRHDLLPYLETYNPNIRNLLFRTAEIVEQDEAVLDAVVSSAWRAAVSEVGPRYVRFDLSTLQAQAQGVQRRLLRKGVEHLRPGLRDVGFEAIHRAVQFVTLPSRTGQLDLVAGLRLLQEDGHLWLASWDADLPVGSWPQAPEGASLELHIPGNLQLGGDWHMEASLEDGPPLSLDNPDPFRAWLDASALEQPLVVKGYQPGDRFQPLGMPAGSIKLSDFYTNRKLPRRARRRWPVVYSGGQVAWVPGFQPAHPFRIQPATRQAVVLRLSRDS